MKLVETRVYSFLMLITDYILLGMLWVVGCLPLVTFVASCNGIVYTMRQWHGQGSGEVLRNYWTGFKRQLPLSLLVSLLFLSLYFVSDSNVQQLQGGLSNQWLAVIYLLSLIVSISLLFRIIWQMTGERQSWQSVLRSAVFSVVTYFLSNLLVVGITLLFIGLVFVFPPFIFLFAGGYWKLIQLGLAQKF